MRTIKRPMKTTTGLLLMLIFGLAAVTGSVAMADPAGWTITQLTNNGTDDISPQISGSNIVWQCHDGNDYEIFFYNGSTSTTTQLTNNDYDDINPQISGSNVVWQARLDATIGYEIFLFDGSTTTQLTNNEYDASNARISGSNVVWQGFDGSDYEIFFWNGSTTTQLTNNSYDDTNPQIDGTNLVWQGNDGNDLEIFFYNGSTTTQLTNNTYDDTNPLISGSNVVWVGRNNPYSHCGGISKEILFYDDSTINEIWCQASIYDINDLGISGSNIVWNLHYDYHDDTPPDVFLFNDSMLARLNPMNPSGNETPRIFGSNVVWQTWNGNEWEIFFYNGSTAAQLTNNSYDDTNPRISGSNVVWQAQVGGPDNDWEIFLAKLTCPYIVDGDINYDCRVDFKDLAHMASAWLVDCIAEPSNPACVPK